MVIDFSKIDFTKRPKFILRNLDDSAIGYLGNVLKPKGTFCYNEISEISFEYPSQINGEKLDEYDLLTGMRVIDVQGYGQFILRNPEETDNGVVKIKSCKAYSLEHELTNKNITLEEGTYCFWNPFAVESSVLGIIMSEVPSWTIGTVSNDLIGKYRTFSVSTKNIYDWIKSDLQEAYGCIFDFDTYNRKINVRSVNEIVSTKPVYLSTKNLIKEIEIEENTDDLVTALDVYGADGVTIRSVNPMGLNRIFNLDAYMNDKYFSNEIIQKWGQWKSTFESYQQPYYQLIIAQNMQISRYTTEESVLSELKGELLGLESKQSAIHQAIAVDKALQSELDEINRQIASKKSQISTQENLLRTIQRQIDNYTSQLKDINKKTAFEAFFSSDELKVIDRYFRCGSLNDSSFVATSTNAYAVDTKTISGISAIFNLSNLTSMTQTPYGNDMTFYIVRGGSIGASASGAVLNAQIVNGILQVNSDKSFVFSLYLNKGTFNGVEFPSGSLAMTGTLNSSVSSSDTSLQFKTSSATLYLTQDVTEYQKMSIEWELFEYGFDTLKKLSSPDYFFSTSVVNFLALDDYIDFAKALSLGERAYVQIENGVVTPIVTSVEIDFDDLTDFTIDFGNAYKLNDASFKFEDLLDQSISSASSLDFNKYNYSNFVTSGAKTQVKDFMTSAIDTMKNMIMSGANNELTIDQTGLRCRKYVQDSGGYSPKQLWLAHNAIMFTNDNWNSATIGIGEFVDKNLGSIFGIVAPAIVGTILAGTSLVIESEKQDGGVAVFKVDAEGASLHNASFNLYGSTGGRIDLGAIFGIVGGANKDTLFNYDNNGQPTGVRTANGRNIKKVSDISSGDSPNANFWLDMDGNAYLKGKMIATSGEVGGFTIASSYLYSGSGNTRVAINGGTSYYSTYAFWAGAENPANAPAWIKKNGDVHFNTGDFAGTLKAPNLQGILKADPSTGGWLEGCGIRVGANSASNTGYNFYVDTSGNVTMKGSINLTGNITWGTSNSPVRVLYSRSWQQTPVYLYTSYPSSSSYGWHRTLSVAYDYYVSYSYDGGQTWTDAIKLQGEDGQDGENGSDASVTRGNIARALYEAGNYHTDGIYSFRQGSQYYLAINASYILAGDIDADKISLTCGYGGFCKGYGYTGVRTTYGSMMYGSNGEGNEPYFIVTNTGCRMSAPNDIDFYITGSGVYSSEEVTIRSDKRIKNSICYDMSMYEKFFMALQPTQFKYNSGQSGRTHIGFVAQDVEGAINKAGLTTKQLAALVKTPVEEIRDDGISDYRYGIRYGEFIALNTYMIQKLYRRIEELEQTIQSINKEDSL